MEIDKLLEIANEILKDNDECLLSGSLALHLQDRKTRRQPKDIDIFVPFNQEFKVPDGMKVRSSDGDNDEYDDEYYERTGYIFRGVDVDVFTPIDKDTPEFLYEFFGEIMLVKDIEIIKMKVSHAFGEHWTRHKNAQDVIHLMLI